MAKLNTSTPSGFPEFSPAEQRVIQQWKRTIAEIFEKNGFPMLETPLVERAENFEAKGGNAKEIYILDRLRREEAADQDKDVRAIRFDHTVPLALYVARHFNELAFPFRRSVIGPVMRGERAQKGRFRQFDQCDIDVVGSEKLSLANDAQMVAIISQIFERLMPDQGFIISISNIKILKGLFGHYGFSDRQIIELKKVLDDYEKVSYKEFSKRVHETGVSEEFFDYFMKFMEDITKIESNDEIIKRLKEEAEKKEITNSSFLEGVKELEKVWGIIKIMIDVKLKDPVYLDEIEENGERRKIFVREKCKFNLWIVRGLDYYTGTVYETNLLNEDGTINKSLGSVCSGGRYDDLASLFTGKILPGVGISIGLTRLLWQLFDAKLVDVDRVNNSEVIILSRNTELIKESIKLGSVLQEQGIAAEVYMEEKKIQKQFDYTKKMGIPCCVIVGEEDTIVECDDLELKAQVENLI